MANEKIEAVVMYFVEGRTMYAAYTDANEALEWSRVCPKYKPQLFLYHDHNHALPVSDVEF